MGSDESITTIANKKYRGALLVITVFCSYLQTAKLQKNSVTHWIFPFNNVSDRIFRG